MASNFPPIPPSKHSVYAAWLFGSVLLLFYMGVFFSDYGELPEFKHKQLAIFSALLCALFTFFFVGSFDIKVQWLKLSIKSCGSMGVFLLILWWWNNSNFSPPVQSMKDSKSISKIYDESRPVSPKATII